MKASILAVGTELTTGQITNANASWISNQLKSMGVLTELHLTVPDDRSLIQMGLKLCAQHSELIFVTGGLGPTSDDFTRDLIAEWAHLEMRFDEASWQKVIDRLTSRGFPVHEFQKQQCYFPISSQILDNSQGTANAFYLQSPQHLWALPGPPREIEAIWEDHIKTQILNLTDKIDLHHTRSWDVLGLGENQVAKLAEPVVQSSGLEVGYRVHLPYVEFKLSYYRSQEEIAKPYLTKIEEVLAPYCAARDGEDAARQFFQLIPSQESLVIVDQSTEGFLLRRLQPHAKEILKRGNFTYTQNCLHQDFDADWKLEMKNVSELSCELKLTNHKKTSKFVIIESPFKAALMSERKKQYYSECAILEAVKHWKEASK